jgi:hypothetical protein
VVDDAKLRKHCGHVRAGLGAADRRNVDVERASAPAVRGSDIVVYAEGVVWWVEVVGHV